MPDLSDGEDDYLSMTFDEPAKSTIKESSLARTARLKREAAERGRVLSKVEKTKAEEERRNAALTTKLDSSTNKGALLMAKMGFAGGSLGAAGNQGRENPVELSLKLDRGGIGMDNEKKRKFREEMEEREANVKRSMVTEGEYRERARQEREDEKAEGQWRGAMKVLEGLDEAQVGDMPAKHRLKDVNLLYRPLVRDRREAEYRRINMKSIYEDRKTLRDLVDLELDSDDKTAMAQEVEDDQDEEDEELREYESQLPLEKLERVVKHLRTAYHYCHWCKYQYEDAAMEGCPGLSEDEHG